MKFSSLLDLNGTILRVAVNKAFPLCDFKTADNGEIILQPSIEVYYLQILMKVYNFNVQLIDMKNQWGTKVNGTWDGVVGMVNSSRADFGMCDLSPTYERFEAVDFSFNTIEDGLSIVTCPPKPKQYPCIVSVPFTGSVWALIFLTIFTLSLLQYYNSKDKLPSLIFNHYTMLLRQSIRFTVNFSSSPMLYCVWLVLGVVLSTSYVAVFHSILTFIDYEEPLDTPEAVERALAEDRAIFRTLEHTFFAHLLKRATRNSSSVLFEMKQHLERNNLKQLSTHAEVIIEIFRWNNTKPFVLMNSMVYINQINEFFKGYRNLLVSQNKFLSASNSLAFPHNSSLLLPFNSVIQKVFESGILEYWIWQTHNEARKKFKANPIEYFRSIYDVDLPELANPKPEQITANVRILLLEDMNALFYLCLTGLASSSIIFLLEIFWFLFNYKFPW